MVFINTIWLLFSLSLLKYGRGPKLEGCAFANFGNSRGTEEDSRQLASVISMNYEVMTSQKPF